MLECDLPINVFKDKEIILLGENIELNRFSDFNVVAIIGNSTITELPVYDNHYLLNLPKNTIVIIVDENWDDRIRYEFNALMCRIEGGG